jgi:hypothetical protein
VLPGVVLLLVANNQDSEKYLTARIAGYKADNDFVVSGRMLGQTYYYDS